MIPLMLLLAAAPSMKLAAPGLACVNLDDKQGNSLLVHFSQQLSIHAGVQVVSPQEVATIIGIERQRQLLGCSEDSSRCAVEIANALGVDAVIVGTLSRVGSGYVVNLKIVKSSDASTLALYSGRPKSDDELYDFVERSAKEFGATLHGTPAPSGGSETAAGSSRLPAWLAAGGAVVALGAGGAFYGLSKGTESDVRAGKAQNAGALASLAQSGKTQQTVGFVLFGVGAAAAVLSAVLFAVTGTGSPVAFVPDAHGGTFAFTWELR